MIATRSIGRSRILLIACIFLSIPLIVLSVEEYGLFELNLMLGMYVSLFLSISMLFIFIYKGNQSIDFLCPAVGLIILMFLYSTASAIYVEIEGKTNFGFFVNRYEKFIYYLSCLFGLIGLIIGTLLSKKIKNRKKKSFLLERYQLNDSLLMNKLAIYSFVLSIILFPFIIDSFNFISVGSYSENILKTMLNLRKDAFSGLKQVLFVYIPNTYILSLSVILFFRHKHLLIKSLFFLVFFSYIAKNVLAGDGSATMSGLMLPTFYYHYRIKEIAIGKAIVGGIVIYLFINSLNIMRYSSSPTTMWTLLQENIDEYGYNFLKLWRSGELITGTNLFRLIGGIERGEIHYIYFHSISTELLTYIPRALFPGRPLPLSEQFMLIFYPQAYAQGRGFGFFLLMEGYWAFGVFGVFIYMLLFGYIVQNIYQSLYRSINRDYITFVYACFYSALVLCSVRTGVVGSLKAALMNVLPFVLLIFMPPRIYRANSGIQRRI
jgi:oligosaccharide repeat unit polymerase